MEGKRQDDMRFLLEDALLDDLLGDLAADHALADSAAASSREIPAIVPSAEAADLSSATEVSLDVPREPPVLSTDGDGDQASETASQASSDTSSAVTKKPMTNSTRERMKQELTYLRNKVVDLEQQLAAAKRSATEMANAVPTTEQGDGDGNDSALVTVPGSLWERVARHQRVEKQKAERKNAELRLLLEDQLKVARSLEKALRKRPSATLSSGLVDEFDDRTNKRVRLDGESQDPSIYERLSERADRSYEELAAIWRRTGFDTCKSERNDSQVLVDSLNRLYLEVTTAKIVPFSMDATDHAAWACISQPTLKFSHGVYRGTKASRNAIHSNSEMSMRVGTEEAHMQMAIVTKRFEEKDRIVYVLESSCSGGGSRELLQNLQIVERGWVVVEPVRTKTVTNVEGASPGDDPEAEPMESAILQVCMRLVPAVSNDMAATSGAGALTEFMITAFRQNLGFLFQTIENMLVEQMIAMGVSRDIKERHAPE